MAPESEFCTAREVAGLFDVTPETVRRWARSGRIKVMTLPSGRRKFRRSDVEELVAAAIQESA